MKIPHPLPQFNEKRALIVTTGDKVAEFYVAFSGILEKTGEFVFEEPTFSDREGFFVSAGRRGIYGSGAVYENLEPYIDKKFLKGFGKKMKDILGERKAETVYLLTAADMKDLVYDILPKDIQKIVKLRLVGNYTKKHPLDIVRRINREETGMLGANVPRKLEARKILSKARRGS